ncbi:MAG: hypothetical protein RR561_08685 [Peptostreptococcus sp.]|uniref:hypothetical protein n=1 Tax=Peptostreptococcus sp. TaxID=1262 RepID=UPI002FC78D73
MKSKKKRSVYVIVTLIVILLLLALFYAFSSNKFGKVSQFSETGGTSQSQELSKEDIARGITFDTSEMKSKKTSELIKTREEALMKNIEKEAYPEDKKELFLNDLLKADPWTLEGYVKSAYPELNEKERLMKQINLINFANYSKEILNPAGEYFMQLDINSQFDDYLKYKGREDLRNPSSKDNISNKWVFLIENLDDLSNFVSMPNKLTADSLLKNASKKETNIDDKGIQKIREALKSSNSKDKELDKLIKDGIKKIEDSQDEKLNI